MPIEQVAEPDPPGVRHLMTQYEGDLAFDVGANVGQSAVVLMGSFNKVVSFEPAWESFEILHERAAVWPNVEVVNVAVTSRNGAVKLLAQDRHIARGQLSTMEGEVPDGHAWGAVVEEREVPGRSIDSLVYDFGRPDMIKCDVEGHEVEVFRGATETLMEKPALWIEVHNEGLGATLEAMLRPIYKAALQKIEHPHYGPDHWGRKNHYWWAVF